MSLDVYLKSKGSMKEHEGPAIFILEDGEMREISRAEWDERFPGRSPVMMEISDTDTLYTANITHNLTRMADAAGIYQALWHPDEAGLAHARDLITLLTAGLARLKAEPVAFLAYNPSNGWGDYQGLVRFVEAYLAACQAYPDAEVEVSR